ncbi:hypothetical protein GCM10027020_25410 [Nocardioides salsibiostraticola]
MSVALRVRARARNPTALNPTGLRRTAGVLALTMAVFGLHWSGANTPSVAASDVVSTQWSDAGLLVPNYSSLDGQVGVTAGPKTVMVIRLENARFVSIPKQCLKSSTINPRSRISADSQRLECWLTSTKNNRTVNFRTLVFGSNTAMVRAQVTVSGSGSGTFPSRMITPGAPRAVPGLRLLSSPDFLNADVADLRRGPNFWRAASVPNGTNSDYERALNGVLDDWQSTKPDAVLVAGDMVNGHWGLDKAKTGVFGPVKTFNQKRKALARAASTYYSQWLKRFSSRDLDVFTAMGDHEFGDDPFLGPKRRLAPTFEKNYAKYFTKTPAGKPLFSERPRGKHEFSAYAGRPRPDTLVVTLNVFDTTKNGTRIRVDRQQMKWLRKVLAQAKRDDVKWIIVQGHTPILWPVRVRGSSGLHYENGRNSELWKVFKKYGVDLYLTGEVHDITATEADGITQIAHGGAFQFGLTNYLLLDFYGDFVYITARDYDATFSSGLPKDRVWETRPGGGPASIKVKPEPFTVGTAMLMPNGELTAKSGLLLPWNGGYN